MSRNTSSSSGGIYHGIRGLMRDILQIFDEQVLSIIGNGCIVCGESLKHGERQVCLRCLATLPRTYLWLVPHSSRRLAEAVNNAIAPPGFLASWYYYNPSSPAAEIIRRAKYHEQPELARRMARYFALEMLADAPRRIPDGGVELKDIDVLLPMPMHWRKWLSRTFNQADYIADGLSEELGIPVGDNLEAVRRHTSQTHMSGSERRRNLQSSIRVNHPQELDGLNVAIVDDVFTTGASMFECAHAISLSGARPASISVLTLGLTVQA
ncbi:MAG: ComF family protein [Muribaculaceae bacterium]|nr:ComF family protein [Muribaculaceae bacterium]